ncbi:MAG: glycoside hydrolase family 31 protein [Dysgonamonadaceae bacterium]|jgi:alpha-glucosidase (family GH31 glycosyl hydrolase)|nr:glycoside hydrolase family 31 protein [Dysgonamonadaceae bacterium]
MKRITPISNFAFYILYFTFCILLFGCSSEKKTQELSSNIAYQDNKVRFTVVTDGVIRLEWAQDGAFTDAKSFVAVNREYPEAEYKLNETDSLVEISTAKMTLKYRKGSGKFTPDNLSIISADGIFPFTWKPGAKQQGNLKGTYRTLDGYDGNEYAYKEYLEPGETPEMPIEDGLLATDGWTLIDDSRNFLFDNSEWEWVAERPDTLVQDWYFLGYGHDYKAALKDFTIFAGKVPLPPRYAFGYWWSRYWAYTDNELRELVHHFQTYDIPLDVMVIDMDWHHTYPGKGGWTGFSWNKWLFPQPEKLLNYLHDNGLKVTLNLHPADGVAYFEDVYPAMSKAMSRQEAKDTIKYVGSDKNYMSAWYNEALRPLEKMGVDFWWLDWQQELFAKEKPDLSNTWWINYTTFTDMERNRDTRPMLYHRWGGLGNHRYQIGFSGDALITWKSLDFQPYFNTTASNVLYGYWSHDLGGHYDPPGDSINPEMLTRWMQFGALSPIMRTHASKSGILDKQLWRFGHKYLDVLRKTVVQRYELAPYIYTMARKTYEEGLSLCRPMYYDYPEAQEAYDFRNEYMFGDEILVSPITAPMTDGYAAQKVWLPQGGDWYEWSTGTLLKGGQTLERRFAIDEYPVYVKAGAILPLYNGKTKNLSRNDEEIVVTIFPGGNGESTLYEDNGNDKNYAENYALTKLSSVWENNSLNITIGSRKGNYKDMPACRNFKLKVLASAIPEKITVNGKTVNYSYCGDELALMVDIPETACSKEKTVKITYAADAPDLTDGLAGKFRRIGQHSVTLRYRAPALAFTEELGTMEATNRSITYEPEKLNEKIEIFRRNYAVLPEIMKQQKCLSYEEYTLPESEQQWFLKAIDWKK